MVGSKCRDFKNRKVSNVNAPNIHISYMNIASIDSSVTLYSEFLPSKVRGLCVTCIEVRNLNCSFIAFMVSLHSVCFE